MSQGLSIQQAPPFVIVFGFFLTAALFGVLGSTLELYFSIEGTLNLPALVHLYTVGFALFTMFGALFQMLPVVAGAVIKNPKPKALASYLLLLSGFLLMLWGFLEGRSLLIGAFLTYLGIAYTSILMLWHLLRIKAYIPTPLGFKYALLFLLVGTSIGLYLVLSSWGYVPFWNKLFYFHLTFLLFGWVALLVASVSFRVVEMFFVTAAYPSGFAMNFPLLVLAGLSLSLFGGFFTLPLVFLYLAYSYMTLKRLIRRKRKREPVIPFWYLSQSFLIISLLLYPFLEKALLPFLFSFLVFFSSIIMGMMYRIIPFLVWFHLSNMPAIKVPLMSEVISYDRIRLSFYLHSLWIVSLVVSYLTGLGFVFASLLHLMSSILFLYNIYTGSMLYFRLRRI
ncbi:MAG: hypothetical protein ACK4OF_02425 [Aquificaceae bacterium]